MEAQLAAQRRELDNDHLAKMKVVQALAQERADELADEHAAFMEKVGEIRAKDASYRESHEAELTRAVGAQLDAVEQVRAP